MVTTCLIYGQTYTITAEELLTLETIIKTQQNQLTELKTNLTEALTELKKAEADLNQQATSFNEYESAALRVQERMQADLVQKTQQLKGWQIALPITGAVTLIGGFLIGHFITGM
jgi:multidrug resistance efflux pump